jgi:signal transduction histidine kinase
VVVERSEDDMALEGYEGMQVAGGGGAIRPLTGSPGDEVLAPPPVAGQARRVVLRRALAAIRRDLGFDTATVYASGPDGWHVLERDGVTAPWHGVLDPGMLEGLDDAVEYPDVRAIPRIGERLAGLGCVSLAMLPLPYGGRLLLDSRTPATPGGWVERTRPYLDLIGIMAGPSLPATSALQSHEEVAALDRMFTVCQDAVARPSSTLEELLASVRDAIRADELFVISDRGFHVEVLSSPARAIARIRRDDDLTFGAGAALDDANLRRLALAVGASCRALSGAVGRGDPSGEIVLAGWAEGPAMSPVSTSVVARTVSTARTALQNRQRAVTTLFDQERTRMAYALHDDLTQTVTGAVLELEGLRKRIERDPKEAMDVLETSKAEIRRALTELRATLFELSQTTEQFEQQGPPLARYVEDVVKRWRLPARVAVEGSLNKVPPRILSVAYTVIREALANAAKHSATTNVTVTITADEHDLTVTVGDSGRGFTQEEERAARHDNHFGLSMLRRRVNEVGGEIEIESRPGIGTRVIAQLPIEDGGAR